MPRDKNNPQLEDGFTRISNDLLAAILAHGFSQRELSVLFSIIRKTYGYGKKTDDMSASQIAAMCNIARPHVSKTLGELALQNVISKTQGRFGMIIGIQKNHRRWVGKDLVKGSLASTDSVQGCTDLGQGGNEDENTGNSVFENTENAPQAASLLDSDSTDSVHPSTDLVHVPICIGASTDLVQVDSTDSVHTKENLPKETKQKKTSTSSDDDVSLCPVGSLVDMYHELMPANPRVKVLNEPRKKAIRARWKEAAVLEAAPFGYATKSEGISAWRTFFEHCAKSDFLTGKVPGKDGKKPFRADVEFLFSPNGFAKAVEGKYHPEAIATSGAGNPADPDAWRRDPRFRGAK